MAQNITPCLWFETDAEAAIEFYRGIFDDFEVTSRSDWGPGSPFPEGTLLSARFRMHGTEFMLINAGPHDTFNDSISLYVKCADQSEVDRLWSALLDGGGRETQCGWLKDRFGISWQIVPVQLEQLLGDPDPEKVQRVTAAMLQMVKIDVAGLQAAYEGTTAPVS